MTYRERESLAIANTFGRAWKKDNNKLMLSLAARALINNLLLETENEINSYISTSAGAEFRKKAREAAKITLEYIKSMDWYLNF